MTRIARPATAVAIAAIVVALAVAEVPVSHLAGQGAFGIGTDPLALAFAPIGLLVATRKPGNPIGWTLLVAGLFAQLDATASLYTVAVYRMHHHLPLSWLAVLAQPSWAPAIVLFGVAVQLFPTGRLPDGRWRWVLWAYLAIAAVWVGGAFAISLAAILQHTIHVSSGGDLLRLDHPSGTARWWGVAQQLFFPALGVTFLAWLARELPSFRRSAGEHRQQLKWMMGGAIVAMVCGFLTIALSGKPGIEGVAGSVSTIGVGALPVGVGVGVLKYRLYEIDRLISRTISYAVVTGSLAAVFLGLIFVTTRVLPFSSPVGVAASTLAAAALFNPLRQRVQRLVDRRFNRARYDAEAAIEAFARRLRDAVDLESVESGLVESVGAAVEPAHLSVWLRPG